MLREVYTGVRLTVDCRIGSGSHEAAYSITAASVPLVRRNPASEVIARRTGGPIAAPPAAAVATAVRLDPAGIKLTGRTKAAEQVLWKTLNQLREACRLLLACRGSRCGVRVAHTQSNRRRRDGHRDKEAHEFCPALRCLHAMVTRFACFAVSTVDKRLPAVSCVDTRPEIPAANVIRAGNNLFTAGCAKRANALRALYGFLGMCLCTGLGGGGGGGG